MAEATSPAAEPDFRNIFEAAPELQVVLTPGLTIAAASNTYLHAALRQRELIVGRFIFDVFPDNPADPGATGMRNLRASLDRVRSRGRSDALALQKYDIQCSDDGVFEARYWTVLNSPVFNAAGELAYILHQVEDVTEFVRRKQLDQSEVQLAETLQDRVMQMEVEIYRRAEQVQAARAEAELERARLHALFMDAPASIAVVRGPDMIFELANPRYQQLVGQDRALIGKPVREAVPDLGPAVLQILDRVYATGERFVATEFPLTMDWDNTGLPYEKFLNFVYEPLRDARSQVDGIMGFAYEVTELVVARRKVESNEAELRTVLAEANVAQQRLALLAEASARLTSVLDYETMLQSVADLAVPTLADFCFFDMLTNDDQVQRVAWAHVDPTQHAFFSQTWHYAPPRSFRNHPITRAMETGQTEFVPVVTDAWLAGAATSPVHLQFMRALNFHSLMTVPVITRDRALGALTFCLVNQPRHYTDADRMLAEELARRAALALENTQLYEAEQRARTEAEAAVRARDEFLSVAAHELKTPVTSMRGYAELLLRLGERGQLPNLERLAKALTAIDQQSVKLTRFIDQLLDVSRISSGRLTLNLQPTDLGQLVTEIVANLQATTQRHTLVCQLEDVGRTLVDPLRLEQVLTNLLNNAIKYSPHGGTVWINAVREHGNSVRLSVQDRGIGIALDQREHIFDRFYQAHEGGFLGGMGLGLFISHQIVQLHGGSLLAEFPPEGGTRMVVSLPVVAIEPVETMGKQ